MEIIEVDINKITPDPNQPRQSIDPSHIKDMAQSIRTEGVINPIEIDQYFMIITGEQRWRSAKEAGLTRIPCKIIQKDYDPHERFRRQVIENIHHNTMSYWDTGIALVKLLPVSPGDMDRNEKGQFQDKGIEKLAHEIGRPQSWVSDMIANTYEKGKTAEYLKQKGAKYSLIREIRRHAPEDIKEELKEKVADGKISHREIVNELITAIKEFPEQKEELMKTEFKEETAMKNLRKLHSMLPEKSSSIFEKAKDGSKIVEAMMELLHLLKTTDKNTLIPGDIERMQQPIGEIITLLTSYQNVNISIEAEIIE